MKGGGGTETLIDALAEGGWAVGLARFVLGTALSVGGSEAVGLGMTTGLCGGSGIGRGSGREVWSRPAATPGG